MKIKKLETQEVKENTVDISQAQEVVEHKSEKEGNIKLDIEILNSKIVKSGEQIESIERAVIILEQDNVERKEVFTDKETDHNQEIENILRNWTEKIQKRYKSVGELEIEDIQNLILEVIKSQAKNENKTKLTKAVNAELQAKIEKIESLEYKKIILGKALSNFDKNLVSISTDIKEAEAIIQEARKYLGSEDGGKLELLTDNTDKFRLLTNYKIVEFLKLQSLIHNIEEIEDYDDLKSIEEVSKELKNADKIINAEKRAELEWQYTQLCAEKVKTIFKELNVLENKFGISSSLSQPIIAMIGGLEKFSCYNYDRHQFYDKILDVLLYPENDSEWIRKTEAELNSIRQKILSEQWGNFSQEKMVFEVVSKVLETYWASDDDNLNIEELEYYIDNMAEFSSVSSQEMYALIKKLNTKENSIIAENKRDKVNLLKRFLLRRADQVEFEKVIKLFENRLNYQEDKYKEVLEIKNSITKEFSKYCGILDKSNKENYTKIIRLYLDRLDMLVAEEHKEDVSYIVRKEAFYTLKQSITNIVTSRELKDQCKAEHIEKEISKTLSKLVFVISKVANILLTDILSHLNKIISPLNIRGNYKRKTQTAQTIKLEDLFYNNGRIKEKEGKEAFFKNKTVIVSIDQEEYYRLSEDIHALEKNQAVYKKAIEEYSKELSLLYKRYKLTQLRKAIDLYNSNRNMNNLVSITNGLVYYLSLREEHLDEDKSFECLINEFLKNYHDTIKHLMINEKCDQEIISELRIAIDLFNEDVIQERNINNEDKDAGERKELKKELVSNLKSLRHTLIYKTYKETGFKLYLEEESQLKQQLEQNNLLQEKLTKITQEEILEIIWLRGFVIPKYPEVFFERFNELTNKNLPEQLAETSSDSIDHIQEFIKQSKSEIVLDGLVDKQMYDVEQFIKNIRTEALLWERILSNPKIIDQHKFQKLTLIMQEHHTKFSQKDLRGLILELSKKKESVDLKFFTMNILRLYANKVLADKKNTLKESLSKEEAITEMLSMQLEIATIDAFNVLQIDQNAQRKKNYLDFINHLDQLLETCISSTKQCSEEGINIFQNSLEQKEIKFITDILGISELEVTSKIVFAKFDNQERDEDKITHLKLLLLLPNSFYSNKEDYKEFVKKIAVNFHYDELEQSCSEFHYYIRENIYRYYGLFLDNILNISDSAEGVDQRKSDIQEALRRLYNNISPTDFIKYTTKFLEYEDVVVVKQDKKTNFIIKACQKGQSGTNEVDLSHILQFLYIKEKEHLKALLNFVETDQKVKTDVSTEEEYNETLDKEIVKLLEQHNKQPTTTIVSKIQEIFAIDSCSPIIMWEEELVYLRLSVVRDLILSKIPTQDPNTTKIADILNAFSFFHEKRGDVSKALDTLDLICKNINKFSTLEKVKQSIYSFLHLEDLTVVNHIIKSSDKQDIILDLLFHQVDIGDNKKLKNSIDKLKIILSSREFEEIQCFCKIFILQIREQQNLDNLYSIIDLIIESKAYISSDGLLKRNLRNNNLSLWRGFLEKAIILNELSATTFNLRNEEKSKMVDLLYQIKEEKGKNLQQALLKKIKNLDQTGDIKKLNSILSKIIYEVYKYDAIEKLSQKLHEWDEVLFTNSESGCGEILSAKQLLSLMQGTDKINSDGINTSVKLCLQDKREREDETLIEELLKKTRDLNKKSKMYKHSKNIKDWQEQDIQEWAKNFKSNQKHNEVFLWRTTESAEIISEVISVIIRAVTLYDHHPKGPRDAQLISLLLFLDNNKKGRLGNIYTGEGKTLITVMLAAYLGLTGKRVDIITSSKVLAIRDSKAREPGTKEGYKGFFEMFGLKASNNCDEECEKQDTGEEERKNRYESCNIVYGEAGYFQRDILLSQFFSKDIRSGSGVGDILILDEVDSMMIDNAAKTLYISHNITDMRYLRDVFIHIWAAVNSREERYYSDDNVQKIMKYINQIIGSVENHNDLSQEGDFRVLVPSTLHEFVQMNLKTWVESAYDAKYIGEDNAYIIGDVDSQKQNEVIIMDKDTGVEQTSTKWGNGLHQFIQLKHNGKLSDESLKAVYISNVGYFQRYMTLYGMTGTLGGIEERKLLTNVYGIDFFEIPRFKAYRFEYDFESESVSATKEEWLQNIVENIEENMDQQLSYTEGYLSLIKEKLEKEENSLEKLKQDYSIHSESLSKTIHQQAQCKNNIKSFEAIDRISNEIIKTCENPVLNKFKAYMVEVSEQIRRLKEKSSCEVEVMQILDRLMHLITEVFKYSSDYVIEQSGIEFKNKIKALNVVALNNQIKEKVERLNIAINKLQEKISYIDAAMVTSKKDVEFYKEESQAESETLRHDSRRAMLVICDNIADLKCVEERVRKAFNNPDEYKIYKYDRAYKKFDVSRLEAGNIVIATNIAGRGTDLEVNKRVEENGGLYVILSYMPKNFRIEKQAFGRTARAGNKGSATYIVLDPRKRIEEDLDILQLKKERNEAETGRLEIVQKEQLPKIKLEDELFAKFNKLRKIAENALESKYKQQRSIKKLFTSSQKQTKDPLKLQIDSLKNKWAIWLNKMSGKFNKIHETGTGEILREYELFKGEINSKLSNKYGLIEEPGELNKLGRVYLDNGQYSEALDCFDYIIEKHSLFSSIALYYKAFCILHKEGGGFDAKIKAKAVLKKSLIMLEDDRSKILSRNQILKSINEIARNKGRGLESNCFAKQNEGEAKVLSIHINAINSAIGREISPDCFNVPGIVGDQSQKVFDELLKDQYNIIKNFRISKKCVIASKVVIKDRERQKQALEQSKSILKKWLKNYKESPKPLEGCLLQPELYIDLSAYDDAVKFIATHNEEYVTYNEEFCGEYESYKKILKILENVHIITERQIFRKAKINSLGCTVEDSDLVAFPTVFLYCKEQVLDDLMCSLISSQKKSWVYKEREKKPSSFEAAIYTKEKFVEDIDGLINIEKLIRVAEDIEQKLLGQLDHQVFCNKGDQIKSILTSKLASVNHAFLEKIFREVKKEEIFFGKRSEIQKFCLELQDNQLFSKDEIVDGLRKIINIPENPSSTDQINFDALLIQLGFYAESHTIVKHQLVKTINDKTSLQEEQINNILAHLESYVELSIDREFLEQKFRDVKNEEIFFGKRSEIQKFCLELQDNQLFPKDEIVDGLKKIINISEDPSSTDKTNFDALLMQLGFDARVKFEALNSYNQYSLKDVTYIDKIKEYLEIIDLKECNNDEDTIHKIDQLDFSVDSQLAEKSDRIKEILKSDLHTDNPLKKEDFILGEESFEILRAILADANIITISIFNKLMDKESKTSINPELETILMRMYQANGVITDRDIVLKDAKAGSQELFNRMRELHIIKPPKVNFKLGKAKYCPEFCGGAFWKDSSDPAKRMDYIKSEIEKVVQEVFRLEKQNDIGHMANKYLTGGIGTESQNKELDEKIEIITNIIRHIVGTIKTLPEIKIELKDLRAMFSDGEVPPELMDYIHICFDVVLEYKENRGFDWDCFLAAMTGLAQITTGIALEIAFGGSAHFIAQALISEGIGDIVFAIQASVEGNFSWQSYGQHKVQSLMISLVTTGVGNFLSKGAQTNKLGVGLATKTAISKAIMKTTIVEACTAVVTATVNVGAGEISNLLIEEIADTHFIQYFENWTKEDATYSQKIMLMEDKLNVLYNTFGLTIARQSIEACIESSLNQIISGSLGDKIFAQISSLVGGITKSFSMATKSLSKGNSKAKLLGSVISFVEKTLKVAEVSKNFAQLCNICNTFYDNLTTELAKAEERLIEQQKTGILKVDEKQIAQDKVICAFSGESSKNLRIVQEKMHVAFKEKIKNAFLRPSVSSLLHMAVKPIQQIMTAPFENAMEQLKAHIDSRAEMFQVAIMDQRVDNVVPITAKQKKALEARGEIIKMEDIIKEIPGLLKAEVANFAGQTLETLQKEHGSNLDILVRDGRVYAVLPTYKQLCDNISSFTLKLSGELQIRMAATQADRNIEVITIDSNDLTKLVLHEKGSVIITPIGRHKSEKESYTIAFVRGEQGKLGHYVPLVKDQFGKWIVIANIGQAADTQDACFAQSMAFLNEYEKKSDINAALLSACDSKSIKKYSEALGKFSKHNKAIKVYYLKGATVKENGIIGGFNKDELKLSLCTYLKENLKENPKKSVPQKIIDKKDKYLLFNLIEQEVIAIIKDFFIEQEVNAIIKDVDNADFTINLGEDAYDDLKDGNSLKGYEFALKKGAEYMRYRDDAEFEWFGSPKLGEKQVDIKGRIKLDMRYGALNIYDDPKGAAKYYGNRVLCIPQEGLQKMIQDLGGAVTLTMGDTFGRYTEELSYMKNSAKSIINEIKPSSPRKLIEVKSISESIPIKWFSISNYYEKKAVAKEYQKYYLETHLIFPGVKFTLELLKKYGGHIRGAHSMLLRQSSFDCWFCYDQIGFEELLALRLSNLLLENLIDVMPSKILTFSNVLTKQRENFQYLLQSIAEDAREAFEKNVNNNQYKFFPLILPVTVNSYHWVGVVLEKTDLGLKAIFLDSDNHKLINIEEMQSNKIALITKPPIEQQRYNNCGPEVIENFIYYLTGTRATQEAAVYVHSLLLENILLDSVEYALKIEENNQIIGFLSNQAPLIVYKPITDRFFKAIIQLQYQSLRAFDYIRQVIAQKIIGVFGYLEKNCVIFNNKVYVQNVAPTVLITLYDFSMLDPTVFVIIDNNANLCQQPLISDLNLEVGVIIVGKTFINTAIYQEPSLFAGFINKFSSKLDINCKYNSIMQQIQHAIEMSIPVASHQEAHMQPVAGSARSSSSSSVKVQWEVERTFDNSLLNKNTPLDFNIHSSQKYAGNLDLVSAEIQQDIRLLHGKHYSLFDTFLINLKFRSDIQRLKSVLKEHALEIPWQEALTTKKGFNMLALTLHPDKEQGNAEDFQSYTNFREQYNNPDVDKLRKEAQQYMHDKCYKVSVVFKSLDTGVDTIRAYYEPTLDNTIKTAMSSTYMFTMITGLSKTSIMLSTLSIGYTTYEKGIYEGVKSALIYAAFMIMPYALAYTGVPYIGLTYTVAMTVYTGYILANNSLFLYKELQAKDAALKSAQAYHDMYQKFADLTNIEWIQNRAEIYEAAVEALTIELVGKESEYGE